MQKLKEIWHDRNIEENKLQIFKLLAAVDTLNLTMNV